METQIRTAAYCRVSTLLEEQEGSFDIQAAHFTERISADPTMVLVGIYGDRGKSGLKIQGREGLRQLLEDCEAGRIDLILTKSISRFARSLADCIQLIRRLRELGVAIHFEKENLRSTDGNCDLLLNILAALAQEESRSISQNAVRAHRQYAMEGRPFGRVSYGYDQRWAIQEEEAARVRTAFQLAGQGQTYGQILAVLNDMEHRGGTGILWKQRRLRYLLQNVTYRGDYFSHRRVCLVTGHPVDNRGYRDRFYIEGHHMPMVSPELFDWVQEVVRRGILISNRPRSAGDLSFLQERPEFGDRV